MSNLSRVLQDRNGYSRLVCGWLFALLVCAWLSGVAQGADSWRAGSDKTVITPKKALWMSGYGGRTEPAHGKQHDLWAKALVLDDAQGHRSVVITLDLVGISREVSQAVCAGIEREYGFQRGQVWINCSHTHCGPVVGKNLKAMYFMTDEQWKDIDEYTVWLQKELLALTGRALKKLAPAQLSWGTGKATFAVNRRTNREAELPTDKTQLKGPIDHEVPVLMVRNAQGEIKTILVGYACHATVLSYQLWCGDYPGFAQLRLEKDHPGAVAMFWAGCGADQNPLPRRTVELAENYGNQLASAVEEVLKGKMEPISGELAVKYNEVPLALDTLPTREDLKKQAESQDRYLASRAKMLLAGIDAGQPLSQTYPYPVQTWRLGTGPLLVTLGGEVVVDYSLRLKQELTPGRTWVAGYSNDVMAYIPSRRVLTEGGYEGASSMVYYGLPTIWSPAVEETVVKQVHELVGQLPGNGK